MVRESLYDTFQEQRPISVPWGSKFKVCYFRLAMILLVWNSAPINLSVYFYAKLCLVALKFEISMILKGFSEMLKKKLIDIILIICSMKYLKRNCDLSYG